MLRIRSALTMKKTRGSTTADNGADVEGQIAAYSEAQSPAFRAMCDTLRELIDTALPGAASKVWHGSPVWFIDDNPVVGYSVTAKSVNLLFWNGQALDKDGLKPVGKFRAAQAVFAAADEIDPEVVRRWLKKAKSNVLDSRALAKQMRAAK